VKKIESEIDIPEPFIFGELFELVGYIGLNDRVEELQNSKFSSNAVNINLYANVETDMQSSFEVTDLNNFEYILETEYGKKLENVKKWIKQILLTKPMSPDDIFTHQYDEFSKLLRTCVDHNIFSRSSKNKNATNQQKNDYVVNFLTKVNHNTIIKLVNSAYNTGNFFVDWCVHRYTDNFDILIESKITNQETTSSKSLKPDLIVKDKKSGNILLVGDLKSYYPFLTSNYAEVLKDVINQIPIYSTSKHILNESTFKTKALYPYRFRSRFNLLLRYFKLIRYIEWIFEREKTPNKTNLDGLILFPSKPVLLNVKSRIELRKLKRKLQKLLNFKIRRYRHKNGIRGSFDLRDEIPELESYLESGDSYIDKNEDTGMYFLRNKTWIEEIQSPEEHEVELCEIEQFDKYERTRKAGVISKPGQEHHNIHEIREQHQEIFSEKLKEIENNKFSLLINSSDQGIGKNFTLSDFIAQKKHRNEKLSILFACPRKEPIKFTIEKMTEQLGKLGVQINVNINDMFDKDWLVEDKENKIRIGYIHNDKVTFEHYTSRSAFKKRSKFDTSGSSATEKLNEFLLFENGAEWINIAFVTSDTLPSYIKTTLLKLENLQKSLPLKQVKKILDFFDYIIFDELSNSSPSVRELFVDLIKFRPIIDRYDATIKEKSIQFVVLDASITSYSLFKEMIEDLFQLKGPYLIPFKELMQRTDNLIEHEFELNIQDETLNIVFYRQQITYPLFYSVASIGTNNYSKFDFNELFSAIETEILPFTSLVQKNFDRHLESGEVLFYVDNKAVVEELRSHLLNLEHPVSVVTSEQKDDIHFGKNVIGTNALAFGTSYKDKRIMIILPSSPGVDSYSFKQQVELYRQVTKRMRGSEIEKDRLIVFTSYPIVYEGTSDLEDIVNMKFLQLRNYIIQFLNNRIYHQIPSFSSILNSQNWIQDGYFNSLYHSILRSDVKEDDNQELDEYLEIFMRDAFPRLKKILSKWGLTIIENFEISFDSDRLIKRMPIPSYLTYHVNQELFARHFNLNFHAFGKMKGVHDSKTPMGKIKHFLKENKGKSNSDLEFLYNVSRLENNDEQSENKNKSEIVLNELQEIVTKLENNESLKSITSINSELCLELQNLFHLRFLKTSGSAFLLSLELAIVSDQILASSTGNIFERRKEERLNYKNKLYATASPLKTLFYGASSYYETPITISFRDGNITTFGFLCYYPKFKDYKTDSSYIRLLQKSLLAELFRENVIYLPNILADLEL
jgi:hypothetical protein